MSYSTSTIATIPETTSFKIVLAGDTSGVGKSSLAFRFTQNGLPEWVYDPHVEDIFQKRWVLDKTIVDVEILDTAQQESYPLGPKLLTEPKLRWADGVMIVFSLTDRRSFNSIREYHARVSKMRRALRLEEIPIVIVGNKADAEVEKRQVQSSAVKELAMRLGCEYFEVSAKTGANVENAFDNLIRSMMTASQGAQPIDGCSDAGNICFPSCTVM